REVGIALGIAVLTAVFIGNGGSLTPAGYTDALAPALLVGAGAVAIGLVAALFMPGRSAGPADDVVTADREKPSTTV
ncbi:MAG: MFS transporter, partial [Actinobacteria bacterium]|nr:MFS transporter [Actinomycetota bacterium]